MRVEWDRVTSRKTTVRSMTARRKTLAKRTTRWRIMLDGGKDEDNGQEGQG